MAGVQVWTAVLLVGCTTAAFAQAWPTKPIRLIVSYPAGGGTDITARIIAQKLTESLGRNVIVDNRTGGGGIVGTDAIAKALPDGYTIGMATPSPITIGRALFPSLPYDALGDFAPIILANESASVLVVHPDLPARSVKELVALARVRSLNVAINNVASVHHLLKEMFNHAAGISMNNVPYKGGGLAVSDLLGGQTELLWSVLPLVLPFIQNGRLRALAVASEKRSVLLPNVPTMGESGWPTIVGSGWNGLVAPRKTPRALVARLNAEITGALNAPDVRQRFTTLGFETLGGTPEEFAAFMNAEAVKWAAVIKTAKIKLD